MNKVGIDVSKGKSTVVILRPFGEIVASPFEVMHTADELSTLAKRIQDLGGETRVVMECTGSYYELSYYDVLATLTADAQRLADDPSAAREMVLRYVESVTVYDLYIDISYAPAYAPKQEKRPATSDQESCEPRGSSGVRLSASTNI